MYRNLQVGQTNTLVSFPHLQSPWCSVTQGPLQTCLLTWTVYVKWYQKHIQPKHNLGPCKLSPHRRRMAWWAHARLLPASYHAHTGPSHFFHQWTIKVEWAYTKLWSKFGKFGPIRKAHQPVHSLMLSCHMFFSNNTFSNKPHIWIGPTQNFGLNTVWAHARILRVSSCANTGPSHLLLKHD